MSDDLMDSMLLKSRPHNGKALIAVMSSEPAGSPTMQGDDRIENYYGYK